MDSGTLDSIGHYNRLSGCMRGVSPHLVINGGVGMAESTLLYAYNYLTQPEIRFLEAAAERLIPTDELGPGGRDAGVACYIDHQLCGTWGSHGRNYRSGPWREGTPEQGFQSRLTPQEIYRVGIREINEYCRAKYDYTFDNLTPPKQDEVLKALEKGQVEL